jgi:hypothetical protein
MPEGEKMKTFLFFAVLFAMFILAIVAGYKPSLIEREFDRIKEPIEKHYSEKQAEAWQAAKEKEWQKWKKQIRLPADCAHPHSAIRELECKNQWQNQADEFELIWADKIKNGWKPDGVD